MWPATSGSLLSFCCFTPSYLPLTLWLLLMFCTFFLKKKTCAQMKKQKIRARRHQSTKEETRCVNLIAHNHITAIIWSSISYYAVYMITWIMLWLQRLEFYGHVNGPTASQIPISKKPWWWEPYRDASNTLLPEHIFMRTYREVCIYIRIYILRNYISFHDIPCHLYRTE